MDDSIPQRFVDAWNSHEGANLANLFAGDGTYEDLAIGAVHKGSNAIVAMIARSVAFSRDYRMTLVSEQANADHYAVEWEMAGTNTGEWGQLPATNKRFRFRAVSIGRLAADGKITENRDYYSTADLADFRAQAGLNPSQGA